MDEINIRQLGPPTISLNSDNKWMMGYPTNWTELEPLEML